MELSDRFLDALVYAARLHASQRRKGSGAPYVSHLLRVCGIALEHGADEDEAIAALLHDAVEDQGGRARLDEIRARYGDRVAEIVAGCSDTDQTPKPPWRQRKEAYLAHLPEATPSMRLVSAADKLDNVRSILADYLDSGDAVFARFKGGREGTLWYHRRIVEILKQLGRNRLVDELDRTVGELERAVGAKPERSA
ncbi:MAG: HD domain-containing protein [Thermoguttaceae bacterium]|jgi:(p)ppGpp synthase/HD superfamily hydrolase|nr:HD domain-containing protein [Thermoguttaceae bacterium]